jgi:integrase
MPRNRTGAAIARWNTKNGKKIRQWVACITYFENDKRVYRYRKPETNTKTAARDLAKQMLQELDEGGKKSLDAARMTFTELAEYFEQTYLITPEYVDGRKIAGYRGKYVMEINLKILKSHFRNQRIKEISHDDLRKFKSVRLKTPAVFGKNTRGDKETGREVKRQRSIATVHKELSLLRRVLNVAVSNGWILRNPFDMGDSLINPGDEKPRERILTKEEEEKLLIACAGTRAHLRPIIICALDTGMRRGEIFKLTWADIDFENRIINIKAFNTKTMRQRQVAITSRLLQELNTLWEKSDRHLHKLIFGITTSTKKGFARVREAAGLPDLRFHDLRHTHATRLVSKHLPLSEVGRVLGHTQANTTYRYVNANVETARRAAALLDELNDEEVKPQVVN